MSAVTSSEERISYSDDNALFQIDGDILIDVVTDLGGYTLAAQSIKGAQVCMAALRGAGWTCKSRVWQTIASGNKPGYVEWPL